MSLTTARTPLARLRELLAALDYATEHLPVTAETPFEQLLVALDSDLSEAESAEYIMQLFFAEDVMRASGLPEMQQGLDNSATLQMLVELPVDCTTLSAERQLETFKALNLLTQLMPLGNLGLNSQHKVYFRYGLAADLQTLSATQVAELVGMFGFFLTQFGPLLADFVDSNKDVLTLMQETGFHKAFEGLAAQV